MLWIYRKSIELEFDTINFEVVGGICWLFILLSWLLLLSFLVPYTLHIQSNLYKMSFSFHSTWHLFQNLLSSNFFYYFFFSVFIFIVSQSLFIFIKFNWNERINECSVYEKLQGISIHFRIHVARNVFSSIFHYFFSFASYNHLLSISLYLAVSLLISNYPREQKWNGNEPRKKREKTRVLLYIHIYRYESNSHRKMWKWFMLFN